MQRIYDKRAKDYDRSLGLVENLALGDLRAEFGSQLFGETLEIAIGTGLNLPYYSEAIMSSVGVDRSLGMMEKAAERSATVGVRITLVQADAEYLPFPENAFDTVAISLALCTVEKPVRALREMARVCRNDGRIVLLEHVRSPNWFVYQLERLWTPVQERSFGCSMVRDTVGVAQSQGFHVLTDRQKLFGVFRLIVAKPPELA
ncbi:class I SAM-dependent methyltransferase [soil metagenome]